MKIAPVEKIEAPKYPDKYSNQMRNVLSSAKPNRWLGTSLIGALSATIALGLSGCKGDLENQVPEDPQQTNKTPAVTPYVIPPEHVILGDMPIPLPPDYITMGDPATFQIPHDSVSIPFFEYGKGTGSIGCVALTAPVFMSEEEAFVIISAAFSEAGIPFNYFGELIIDLSIPVTNINVSRGVNAKEPETMVGGNMIATGFLSSFNIPVKFVTSDDVRKWHRDIGGGPYVSFSDYNIVNAAQRLAENNPGLLVFYDPVAGTFNRGKVSEIKKNSNESEDEYNTRKEAKRQELYEEALAKSEQYLREQVAAFIEWLSEGIS
ncbi:MAG: hypothetical protein FWD44_05945 [Oscillospiraceae bacterium]|nr:hypothetical protein [Oscillospiraceae bacterium]